MQVVSFTQNTPKVRTIGTKMLVKPDPPQEREVRGIIIPMATANPLEEGTVILVSEEVAPYVQPGEKILYSKGAGVDQEFEGIKYKFINGPTATSFGDIWAVLLNT